MAQPQPQIHQSPIRQRYPSSSTITRPRPLSADFISYTTSSTTMPSRAGKSSMLYSLLPTAVSKRLPPLPSLRRSVSMYGLSARNPQLTGSRSGPSTPAGDEYVSAMVLSGTNDDVAVGDYFDSSLSSASSSPCLRPSSSRNAQITQQQAPLEVTERSSGIGWKFAGQGLSLLGLSVEESASISRNEGAGGEVQNAAFARQLYIHALTYLLRGLPANLSTEEQLSVRSALPQGVVAPLRVEMAGHGHNLVNGPSVAYARPANQPPSVIHRTLASTIVQIFILFQFILPYIKLVLRAAYQYERTHRISEKVLAGSLETVDGLGRKGASLSGALWGMGLGEVVGWFVEGVAGGIQEGVGEGMVLVGARPSPPATVARREDKR